MTGPNSRANARISCPSSTEAQLKSRMLAAVEGDTRANAALFFALTPILRSFFARRMRDDPGEVDDLIQEVLIAVHKRSGGFDRCRPFMPWLISIARHKLVDKYRRTVRHQWIEDIGEILAAERFEESSDAALDVNRLLQVLPPKQARAIRDTKLSGLSVAEAAARAGMSVSDVKVSVHRGLKALTGCVAAAGCR